MGITTLDIEGDRERGPTRPPRVNWGLVAAALTIVGWLLAGASGVFGDYRKIGDRVNTLETLRGEDVKRFDQQRADDARWRERMESKVDKLLERKP